MKKTLAQIFQEALESAREASKNAKGTNPQDYIYDQAGTVRQAKIEGYVFVTFRDKEYGPARVTFGALDGDKNKGTALIQAEDGKWYKLWFFDSAVMP